MVLEAAHVGKHVLCEKPVALRQEDAEAMIQACDGAGVRFFVCMVVRFFPQYRLAKDLVNKGRIGNLAVLRLKRVSYSPRKKVENWYIDETRSGGMIVDLMIHDFDFARWLGGDVERVFARRNRSDQGAAEYAQAIGIAQDPYTIEICHAYDAIRTGKPFDVTAEDALQSLRIALAARESINTNQPAIL